MRQVFIFLLFSCVLSQANCRPGRCDLRADGQAVEFHDYREGHEEEAAVNDDSGQHGKEERANENDPGDSENELQSEQGVAKYKENLDDDTEQHTQYAYNRAVDGFKQNLRTADSNMVNKRTETNVIDSNNEEGDLLFENYLRNQHKPNSKIAFNNQDENRDLNKQSRYFKRCKSDNRKQPRARCEAAGSDLNRNRRESATFAPVVGLDYGANFKNKLETQEISNEEEEAAIKRHVKKLSSEELEQLLNSLTDDKRGLLKKIIDNEPASYSLNKREITKKASAVEENNLIESGYLQCVSPFAVNSDSPESQSTEEPETEKPVENVSNNNFISGPRVDTTSENKADVVSPSDEQAQSLSTGNIEQAQSAAGTGSCSSVQDAFAAVTKSTNKREAHNDNYNPNHDQSYYSERESDTGYLASQEEGEDDSEAENDDSVEEAETPRKRKAPYQKYSELSDSERSLEDSFPNSKAYEDSDPYAASDMLPLVRVKRKNTELLPAVVKKRAAAIMPGAKVEFIPYKAESDDDDNDEANEFDNNGFYDHTSNLKVNGMGSTVECDSPEQEAADASNENSGYENVREDKAHLGSDTDGVLSGVEGVDENLMLSKQNSELVDQNSDANEFSNSAEARHIHTRRSASEEELAQKLIGKPANAPVYHEIDSFGPLPQDRDTETSRFKRIRRVKQLPVSGETKP